MKTSQQVKTTDLVLNTWGAPALLNNRVCILYENIDTHSIFETDEGSYVYDKVNKLLYQLELEAFNRLLIKVAAINPNNYPLLKHKQ